MSRCTVSDLAGLVRNRALCLARTVHILAYSRSGMDTDTVHRLMPCIWQLSLTACCRLRHLLHCGGCRLRLPVHRRRNQHQTRCVSVTALPPALQRSHMAPTSSHEGHYQCTPAEYCRHIFAHSGPTCYGHCSSLSKAQCLLRSAPLASTCLLCDGFEHQPEPEPRQSPAHSSSLRTRPQAEHGLEHDTAPFVWYAAGPYTPVGSAPLICPTNLGGAIDAAPFTASDGTLWLVWKNDGNSIGQTTTIWLQQLTPNGLSLAGPALALIHNDQVTTLLEGTCLNTSIAPADGLAPIVMPRPNNP